MHNLFDMAGTHFIAAVAVENAEESKILIHGRDSVVDIKLVWVGEGDAAVNVFLDDDSIITLAWRMVLSLAWEPKK